MTFLPFLVSVSDEIEWSCWCEHQSTLNETMREGNIKSSKLSTLYDSRQRRLTFFSDFILSFLLVTELTLLCSIVNWNLNKRDTDGDNDSSWNEMYEAI